MKVFLYKKNFWQGDIRCVKCAKPTATKLNGKGIMSAYGDKVINVSKFVLQYIET